MDDQLVRDALTGFVRFVLNLRLLVLVLTLLWMARSDVEDVALVSLLLLATTLTSLLPVLYWERIGGAALRHPLLLSLDIVVSVVILTTLSVDTPFVLFVLATAMLAGALHGVWGAAASSVALLLAYLAGLAVNGSFDDAMFGEILGVPALIPLVAVGGVAVSRLLVQQAHAAHALAATATTAAAAAERTRLAREMHDTLAKTLHGISLTASTMPSLVHDRPDAAAEVARQVSETAGCAAAEARSLLVALRTDDLEGPVGQSIRRLAQQWSNGCGIDLDLDVDPEGGIHASPSSRYELFCIVREALSNVTDHADAGRVQIRLAERDGARLQVCVVDDGCGFAMPSDPGDLATRGRFGVVGMIERAVRVGGRVTVTSQPAEGTTVTAVVPMTASVGTDGVADRVAAAGR